MRPQTEARIRNVQKFAKNGWQFCVLAGFMLGVYLLSGWVKVVFGFAGTIDLGSLHRVNVDWLTSTSDKTWALLVMTVSVGLGAWILRSLYRLFRQLEVGSIYTKQNVDHLRQIGWLSMALAVFQLFLPLLSFVLAEMSLINDAFVKSAGPNGAPMLVGQSLSGVITAALVLLASWIMDVGTEIRDDADALRRDAELVI